MSRKTQHTYFDVRIAAPAMVIDLRAPNIYRRYWRIAAIIIVICVLILSTLFSVFSRVRAEASLVPQSCLGGWDDPIHAAGTPEVSDNDVGKFSDMNSAHVSDKIADLYCGEFAGEVPKDSKPTTITVTFSWALVSQQLMPVIPAAPADLASSTNIVLDAAPQTVGGAVDASSTPLQSAPAEIPVNPAPPESSTPNQPAASQGEQEQPSTVAPAQETPAPAQDVPAAVPAPAPVVAPEAPQSSLMRRVLAFFAPRVARAQEVAEPTVSSSTVDGVTESATSTLFTDAIVEVSYSLDGTTWHELGVVRRGRFAADATFRIPVDETIDWTDLGKIQIRLRTLNGLNAGESVYVDGMQIHAAFVDRADAHMPPDGLMVHDVQMPDAGIRVNVLKDDLNNDMIKVQTDTGPLGNVAMYDANGDRVMQTSTEEDSYAISIAPYGDGAFSIARVKDIDACESLNECKKGDNIIAQAMFTIAALATTTEMTTVGTTTLP